MLRWALADPTVLTFTMLEPDSTSTTYVSGDAEVIRDSLGLFHVYWDCTQAGVHRWRFAATGTIAAAEEASFTVRESRVLG